MLTQADASIFFQQNDASTPGCRRCNIKPANWKLLITLAGGSQIIDRHNIKNHLILYTIYSIDSIQEKENRI